MTNASHGSASDFGDLELLMRTQTKTNFYKILGFVVVKPFRTFI